MLMFQECCFEIYLCFCVNLFPLIYFMGNKQLKIGKNDILQRAWADLTLSVITGVTRYFEFGSSGLFVFCPRQCFAASMTPCELP